jgi:tight adherence protein B
MRVSAQNVLRGRARRVVAALAAAALVTSLLAASGTASPTAGRVQIAQSPLSNFPDMAYSLALPSDQKLSAGQVHVTENGGPVNNVTIVKPGAENQGAILLIDASDSMTGKPIKGAMVAARAFSDRRNPGQQLAVVFFNDDVTVQLPLTNDESSIDATLSKVPTLATGTHIYDGLESAADLLIKAGIENGAIVLLSDGKDVGSTVDQQTAIAAVNEAKARVFAVGLKSRQYDPAALQAIASQTSGTYTEASSASALNQIYSDLGYVLSHEYLLRYRSLAGPSKKLVVAVRVDGIPGKARSAYTTPALPLVAPNESQSLWDRFIQSPLTLIGIVLLIVGLLGWAVFRIVYRPEDVLTRRIGQFVTLPEEERERQREEELATLAAEERSSKDGWIDRLQSDMSIAGLSMSATTLLLLSLVVSFALGVVVSLLIGSPIGVLAIVLGPLFARSWVNGKLRRQRKTFADQLPENLDVMSSGLRSGHSFTGALAVVVDDAVDPARTEFRRVIADEQLGIPIDEALHVTGRRMDNRDIVQVALVAKLQREAGTNAADVLDQVSENIRNRLELRRLIASLTAQGRMARWIVSLLPILLFIAIYVLNKSYLRPLWTEPAGIVALVIGAIMLIAGSLVIKRIVNIEV